MRIETAEDAAMLRQVLEPIWADYYVTAGTPGAIPSTNMCCKTASMIVEIDPRWRVVHGTLAGHAHAWCERTDGTVLDLTGDQFGAPPVVFGEIPESYLEDDRKGDTECACPGLPPVRAEATADDLPGVPSW